VAYQTLAGITTAKTATNNKKTAVILATANLEKTIVKGSPSSIFQLLLLSFC
jgi:hypothetical protein